MTKRMRRLLLFTVPAGLLVCVVARLWWVALHDPFTSEDVSRRLLLGTTRQEAAQVFGREADRFDTPDVLKQRMSPQAYARFGCPKGGRAYWLRLPVGIHIDFDEGGRAADVQYTVLPWSEERPIDRLRRWLGL